MVGETHLFSPSLVNSFLFAFNRVYSYIVQTPDFQWADLGANIPNANPVTHNWQSLTISGYFTATTGTFWDLPEKPTTERLSKLDRSRHSVKFGARFRGTTSTR